MKQRQGLLVVATVWITLLAHWLTIGYFGPSPTDRPDIDLFSFLVLTVVQTLRGLTSIDSQSSFTIPDYISATPSGSASLTPPHLLGNAGLFALLCLGGFVWLSRAETPLSKRLTIILFSMAVISFSVVFGGPLGGFGIIYPLRWLPFVYVIGSILAALGVTVLVQQSTGSWRTVAVALIAVMLVTSMIGTNYGSPDDPLYDDANGAVRYELTDSEFTLVQHIVQYSGETTVIGDGHITVVVERQYKRPALTIQYLADSESITGPREPTLLIDRQYLQSGHAQFILTNNDQTIPMTGSIPENVVNCGPNSVVYDSGDDMIRHRPDGWC